MKFLNVNLIFHKFIDHEQIYEIKLSFQIKNKLQYDWVSIKNPHDNVFSFILPSIQKNGIYEFNISLKDGHGWTESFPIFCYFMTSSSSSSSSVSRSSSPSYELDIFQETTK